MAIVQVNLPHHRYDVIVQPHALQRLGAVTAELAPHGRCALVADAGVYEWHGDRALASLHAAGYEVVLHATPSGEQHKTLDTVRDVYDTMLEARLERRSPVVALGGGVTGDTAGFVAATYLRGVRFVPCPTTLLAMVDASVGGKVGVNVPQGKNLIGAFHQPVAVVIDPLVLRTLPEREMRCGLAECVKHGVIRDAALFDWTAAHLAAIGRLEADTLTELVARNVAIKAAVVMEDEKETGVRAHLNFGHTFAHAIEATSGYGQIEHGEAVSLGMVAATRLAYDAGRCATDVLDRLIELLKAIGLPTRADLAPVDQLMAAMRLDKKVVDDRIRLVLPKRLGAVTIADDIADEAIAAAWAAIGATQ
ncbi:MAG: 3-dehydroquinate synthase [Deinococcus-Thermus bacterium]|jgi:3-dehydroquinate synthase|nr:3-dehydroquinate synthase [Deinococcota bacterium]